MSAAVLAIAYTFGSQGRMNAPNDLLPASLRQEFSKIALKISTDPNSIDVQSKDFDLLLTRFPNEIAKFISQLAQLKTKAPATGVGNTISGSSASSTSPSSSSTLGSAKTKTSDRASATPAEMTIDITALSSSHKNVTFTVTVDGRSMKAIGMKYSFSPAGSVPGSPSPASSVSSSGPTGNIAPPSPVFSGGQVGLSLNQNRVGSSNHIQTNTAIQVTASFYF